MHRKSGDTRKSSVPTNLYLAKSSIKRKAVHPATTDRPTKTVAAVKAVDKMVEKSVSWPLHFSLPLSLNTQATGYINNYKVKATFPHTTAIIQNYQNS